MFLCTQCKRSLCPDCKEIESEYEELLQHYKQQNSNLSAKVEKVQRELDAMRRRAESFESVAKLGYPEVITKWMDSLAATQESDHATHQAL